MALVTRQFPPTLTRSKKAKRRKHIMLAGGREGPEVAGKEPRTPLFVPDGSPAWTAELAGEKTPEDARTQPPFLRAVVRDYRAYARGLMTVKDTIELLEKAAAYGRLDKGYHDLIEFTGVTTDGKLASFSGRLLDPMVNTMSKDGSDNWPLTLRKLADELRLIEASVPRLTKIQPAPQFALRAIAFSVIRARSCAGWGRLGLFCANGTGMIVGSPCAVAPSGHRSATATNQLAHRPTNLEVRCMG
jgi:hypothetical protein